MQPMYYIGLDVHKRTISYCVKDGSGAIHTEGTIPATRLHLDRWMKTLPQPWTAAMEATVFTGWIYDHLQPHAAALKVAHPLMLRAIAAAKKKNDRIDAKKICDCLRCDFLPECYMASTAIRERRRTLRYRNLLVRQMVQMKNKISMLLANRTNRPLGHAAVYSGSSPGRWVTGRMSQSSFNRTPTIALHLHGSYNPCARCQLSFSKGMPMHHSLIHRTHAAAAKFVALAICAAAVSAAPRPQANDAIARISFGSELSSTPLDGRVYVVFSVKQTNPRMGVMEKEVDSAQVFGADIDGLAPGQFATIPLDAIGYPSRSLADIAPGDYWVQGVLNRYTTFRRSDGHTVKLPMDEGEGQHWNSKPGNLFSTPVQMHIDPHSFTTIDIHLDQVIPPIQPPQDTEWVKHLRIQSQVLTKFWGHPMYLGAIVVLPEGWATHPNARYPLLVNHGHFQSDYHFVTQPPSANGNPAQQEAEQTRYQFYQDWTTGKLPRMILLIIQHANPYYDDSYAVDSANVGPYGDAINKELIPYIEKQFRGIGQGWARAIFGGSTGGWETLATQIFYPDDYNGAWGACPDPVDFHAYQLVDIYDDTNAYWTIGPFGRIAQGEMRLPNGIVEATTEGSSRWENVLGSHGRSGEQWGIWQAVFSPVSDDGYPKPIWDPVTGVINKDVAEYWRQHYDLTAIMMRDWNTLGPKLIGKMHVPVGTGDTFYLNNAVRLMQATMEKTQNPHYVADFDFGIDQPHCYTGPPGDTTRHGGLTFTRRVLKAAEEQMLRTAPPGADTSSWRY